MRFSPSATRNIIPAPTMNIVKCGKRAIAKASPSNENSSARSAATRHAMGLVIWYPDTSTQNTATAGKACETPIKAA